MDFSLLHSKRRYVATLGVVTLAFTGLHANFAFGDASSTFGIEPTENEQQVYADDTPALHWAIRNSFRDYVGEAAHVLDGAKVGSNRDFNWPFKSLTVDQETKQATIQFGGTVNFMQYCNGRPVERPNCELDFTFSSPKVVYDPSTGKGKLYATVHTQDYGTHKWSGPDERHIGNLDFNSARHNSENGVMHWYRVSASLTEEGNKAFSGFYREGGPLAFMSFSLPDSIEPPNRSSFALQDDANSTVKFHGANQMFATNDGRVVHITSGNSGKVQIYDPEARRFTEPQSIKISRNSNSAFDAATNTLYWINDNDVYAATLTTKGIEDPRVLHTIAGAKRHSTGFSFNTATKQIAVIHVANDYKNLDPKVTLISPDGAATESALPPVTQFHDIDAVNYYNEFWGPMWGSDGTALRPLPDGSFIFLYDHKIHLAGGEKVGSVPMHIVPNDDGTATATPLNELSEIFGDGGMAFRGLTTDSRGNIALYNNRANYEGASQAGLVTLKYHDGAFTVVQAAKGFEAAPLIASAAFSEDGKLAVVSEELSKVVLVDPATLQVEQEAGLSPHVKDTAGAYSQGAVFAPDGSLYVMENKPGEKDDYEEYFGIQRLVPPGAGDSRDPELSAYTMAGHELSEAQRLDYEKDLAEEKRDASEHGSDEQEILEKLKQKDSQNNSKESSGSDTQAPEPQDASGNGAASGGAAQGSDDGEVAVDGPSVTIDRVTQLNPQGDTVTVSGKGFKTKGNGIYIGLVEDNRYSYLDADAYGDYAQWVTVKRGNLKKDGSFSVEFPVKAEFAENNCLVNQCSIYTFAAHGSKDRSQDVRVPISFATGADEVTEETTTPAAPVDPVGDEGTDVGETTEQAENKPGAPSEPAPGDNSGSTQDSEPAGESATGEGSHTGTVEKDEEGIAGNLDEGKPQGSDSQHVEDGDSAKDSEDSNDSDSTSGEETDTTTSSGDTAAESTEDESKPGANQDSSTDSDQNGEDKGESVNTEVDTESEKDKPESEAEQRSDAEGDTKDQGTQTEQNQDNASGDETGATDNLIDDEDLDDEDYVPSFGDYFFYDLVVPIVEETVTFTFRIVELAVDTGLSILGSLFGRR